MADRLIVQQGRRGMDARCTIQPDEVHSRRTADVLVVFDGQVVGSYRPVGRAAPDLSTRLAGVVNDVDVLVIRVQLVSRRAHLGRAPEECVARLTVGTKVPAAAGQAT